MSIPRRALIVGATVLFTLFLAYVIVSADRGRMPAVIVALYHFPGGDKVGHFVLMGVLAMLGALSLPQPVLRLGRLAVPFVTLAIVVLVAGEEFSQAFFRGREASIADFAASVAGILCGTWLARIINDISHLPRRLRRENGRPLD